MRAQASGGRAGASERPPPSNITNNLFRRTPVPAPAYRIQTPRLVLRCWQPEDASLLADAVTASLEHLRPWMPWAHAEPEELEAKVQRLRGFRARFDTDQDYVYAIFSADERERQCATAGLVCQGTNGVYQCGPRTPVCSAANPTAARSSTRSSCS